MYKLSISCSCRKLLAAAALQRSDLCKKHVLSAVQDAMDVARTEPKEARKVTVDQLDSCNYT
jgi:hypothetical protein